MKDAYYFSHDSNARHDPKIISLCSKYGLIAYAYYFQLVEILRDQDGYVLDEMLFPVIANAWQSYGNAITMPMAHEILGDMITLKLVEKVDGKITSPSLLKRMAKMDDLRRKRSESGKIGAMAKWQIDGKPMAVKERKVKENKDIYTPKEIGSNGDSFAVFWEAYPRKVAKHQAIKAWNRLNPVKAVFDLILSALARQKETESWKKDGGKFIPHPATWLNGRRWEDEIEENSSASWKDKVISEILEKEKIKGN